jgi:guanosine-3',5'-bis(diphosphate) 3'-pyrophosphohydrolase
MKSKIARALEVASEAHSKQTRKFDGSLYANHLIEVLNLLVYGKEKDTSTLVAGVLHDVLEDTNVSVYEIEQKFGTKVLRLVEALSEDKTLDLETRKALAIENARAAPANIQHIKLADLISNMSAIPPSWEQSKIDLYMAHCSAMINAIGENAGNLSSELLELAEFFCRSQTEGCAIYHTLCEWAEEGTLYWSEKGCYFVHIDEITPGEYIPYRLFSLNNQAFHLGLLRNFAFANEKPVPLRLAGTINSSQEIIASFDEPLLRSCQRVVLKSAPPLSWKTEGGVISRT